MRGFGSAYLWNIKRREEEIKELDVSLGKQQEMLRYEMEFCQACRVERAKRDYYGTLILRDSCSPRALELCFDTYMKKTTTK